MKTANNPGLGFQASIDRTKKRIRRRLRPAVDFLYSARNDILCSVRQNAVRAYWYPENNFGDQLTPDILRHFGFQPLFSPVFEKCDVICVGSILDMVPKNFTGTILGAGCILESAELSFSSAQIGLVRGKLTASKLNLPDSFPVGDPGILADEVYGRGFARLKKTYEVGIVPHYKHIATTSVIDLVKNNAPRLKLIDVRRKPLQVIREIASCKYVISSSLHGLVIAHSFGIPTLPIELDALPLKGGRYKFEDYYSVYGTEPFFYSLQGDETIEELCLKAISVNPVRLCQLKNTVRNAFIKLANKI